MRTAMVRDAVMRNLEIIGEAVKNISDDLKSTEPAIPWRDIASMRDLLIHRYFRVDLDRVWEVVDKDLGRLEAAVERMLVE